MSAPRGPAAERGARMLRTAMGAPVVAALADAATVEVMANPDGRLWLERAGEGRVDTGLSLDPGAVERAIRLVAAAAGSPAGPEHPIVSAELPGGGERFEGVLPPVAPAPCFSIRRPAAGLPGLDALVARGALGEDEAAALRAAVRARMNVVVAGGASSGKTTLANALLAEAAASGDRVIVLEDVRELRCAAADCVALRTQGGRVTLADLVRSALRLRPDRIVVGEVRGGEALALLKAWNTGHPGGIATVHANSAGAALDRLEQLAGEAAAHVDPRLVAEAVDLVAFVAREGADRRLAGLLAVRGIGPDGRCLAVPASQEVPT